MQLQHTKDAAEAYAGLDKALLATFGNNDDRINDFHDKLSAALDLVGPSSNQPSSCGITWLMHKLEEPFAFAALKQALRKPTDLFSAKLNYNREISHIACSALLRELIPANERDDFVLAVVGFWGPSSSDWAEHAAAAGVSASVIAQLTQYFLLVDTPQLMRHQHVINLTTSRTATAWASCSMWNALTEAQFHAVAQVCMRANLDGILECDGGVSFLVFLQDALGSARTASLLLDCVRRTNAWRSMAAEKHIVMPTGDRFLKEVATKSLRQHIQEALESRNSKTVIELLPLYGVHSSFVAAYQTVYYGMLRNAGSATAKEIDRHFRLILSAKGWQVGAATIQLWKGERRPYVHVDLPVGGTIAYVQRHGSYMPEEGEEVIFAPNTSRGIKPDLYAVNFVRLVR